MRNGVIPVFFDSEIEALDATVCQATMTHYSPLSVVCCAVHTLLIHNAIKNKPSGMFLSSHVIIV